MTAFLFRLIVVIRSWPLINALVRRHISARYRGSMLGILWTLLNPLAFMLVYLLVFKYYVRIETVHPYGVFVFAGMLPWLWFSCSINEGASSIASSGHLITKSLFPAEILPIISVFTNAINFVVSLPILFLLMYIFEVQFSSTIFLLPLLFLLQVFILIGITLFVSALNTLYRDVQHIVQHLLNLLFFLLPILYPLSSVPSSLRFTFEYNPIAHLLIAYRLILLDGQVPSLYSWGIMTSFAVVSIALGSWVFSSLRERFAEVL